MLFDPNTRETTETVTGPEINEEDNVERYTACLAVFNAFQEAADHLNDESLTHQATHQPTNPPCVVECLFIVIPAGGLDDNAVIKLFRPSLLLLSEHLLYFCSPKDKLNNQPAQQVWAGAVRLILKTLGQGFIFVSKTHPRSTTKGDTK